MLDHIAVSAPPRMLLPAGITSDFRPRLEWKWNGSAEAWQVRVSLADAEAEHSILWESRVLPAESCHTVSDLDLCSHESLIAEVRARVSGEWTPWGIPSIFRIEPVPPLQGSIVVYDLEYTRHLSPLQAFAHAHLLSALQGLVNRHEPSLYVKFVNASSYHADTVTFPEQNIDDYWLNRLDDSDGGWLAETSLRVVTELADLLDIFGDAINGAVVWDAAVPATSNIASIIAGAEDLLPVPCCNDSTSLYTELIAGLRIPVVVDLRGKFTGHGTIADTGRPSTGSAKCDAYLWAVDKYLLTGKCSPGWMGHYIDGWWVHNPNAGGDWQNHTLTNHDYFISRRAFFWDLNIWDNEAPVDDPDQQPGTDAATLREILTTANCLLGNGDMIHVGGFTPWAFKYTNHPGAGGTHSPQDTERELVRVLSAHNACLDADAVGLSALANASFLCHFPLAQSYAPVLAATPGELRDENLLTADGKPEERNFVLNYVGDYDSAAWVWNTLTVIWESPGRGEISMAWGLTPNMADRAAPLFDYIYRTRTANDHFISGDKLTKLRVPRESVHSPDAPAPRENHTLPYHHRLGIRLTGSLICSLTGEVLDIKNSETDVDLIRKKIADVGPAPRFMVFRQILKEPQYYCDMFNRLTLPEFGLAPVFCDPHTFACLARAHKDLSNDDQAVLLFAAVPHSNVTGTRCKCDIGFRNDGWNTWSSPAHTMLIQVMRNGSSDIIWRRHWPLPHDVHPGESVLFRIHLPVPEFQGRYRLNIDIARDGVAFSGRPGLHPDATIVAHRAAPPISV